MLRDGAGLAAGPATARAASSHERVSESIWPDLAPMAKLAAVAAYGVVLAVVSQV